MSSVSQPCRSSLAREGRNWKQACASSRRPSRASMPSRRSRRPCKCSTSEAAYDSCASLRVCAPQSLDCCCLDRSTLNLAHQILQAVAVGVGAGKPRGDLGAVHRLRHHAEGVGECGQIEPREVKDLRHLRIGQQRLQVRRVGDALAVIPRDLHHVGAAVAVRQLHHAEPVAMRVQPHGLGIDRH